MKLCVNCQYYQRNTLEVICTHPSSLHKKDFVEGKHWYRTASFMRNGTCGQDAQLFQEVIGLMKALRNLW